MNMQISILNGARKFYKIEKERMENLINDKNDEIHELENQIKELEKMKDKLLDPMTSPFIFKICRTKSIINNNTYYEYYYNYLKSEFIKKEKREFMKLPLVININYFEREFFESTYKLENNLEEVQELIDSYCDNIIEEYKPETIEELINALKSTINTEKFELHVLNYKIKKLALKK